MADNLNVSIIMKLVDNVTSSVKNISKSFKDGAHQLEEYKKKSEHAFEQAEHIHQSAEGVERLHEKLEKLREAPIEHAMQFEVAVAKLGNTARDASVGPAALTKAVTQMAIGSEFSSTKVAQSMTGLVRSGLTLSDSVKEMPKVMEFASATTLDLGQAAELTGGLLKSFKLSADQTEHATDVMAAASRAAGVPVEQFGQGLATLGSAARAAGVPMDTVAAVMAAMGKSGSSGEQATAAMQSVLSRLSGTNPRALKMVQSALGAIGIKANDASGKLKDLPTLFGEIQEKTAKMSDAQKRTGFGMIFGPEAASAMMNLFKAMKPEELKKFAEGIKESEGAVKAMDKVMNQTAEQAQAKLDAALENLSTTVGSSLLPGFKSWRETLTGAVNGITKFVAAHPQLTSAMAKIFSLFVMATGALGSLLSVMSAAKSAQAIITLATGWVKLGISMAPVIAEAAVAAAPFIAIAAAIGAVTLAIVELVKHWKELDFLDGFKGIGQSLLEGVKGGDVLGLGTIGQLFDPRTLFKEMTSSAPAEAIGEAAQTLQGSPQKVETEVNVHLTGEGAKGARVTSVLSRGADVGATIDNGFAGAAP